MGSFPAEFLARYIEENVGPLGVIGQFPLGAVGYISGVPGLSPTGIDKPESRPALFGGLAGLAVDSFS